jgi:ABC-type enterobactin transport system permease subunit
VISKTASLDGHRTIIIQIHSFPEVLANVDALCAKSNVNEALITALYEKGIIDKRFKNKLVGSLVILITECSLPSIMVLIAFRTALAQNGCGESR